MPAFAGMTEKEKFQVFTDSSTLKSLGCEWQSVMNDNWFSFEDLGVWQDALDFADECLNVSEYVNKLKHYRLAEQLDASAVSIPVNIAEGKGRYSKKEFAHFLHIARGSLFETVALLIIFNKRRWIDSTHLTALKSNASRLGKRINALFRSLRSKDT